MIRLIKTVLLIVLLNSGLVFAENPCNVMMPRGGNENWGIGAYLLPDIFSMIIYDDSDDMLFGTLSSKKSFFELKSSNGITMKIVSQDVEFIGRYKNIMIKIKECFNPEFVKVFWNTSDSEFYMSKEELESNAAKFLTYRNILKDYGVKLDSDDMKIGVNINKSCLNLRKDSTLNSEKLICIPVNDWSNKDETVVKVLDLNGDWAFVEYSELHPSLDYPTNDEDCFWDVKNKKIGWVKAIGKNGFPNIWFSVTGY